MSIGDAEIKTQERVIRFFKDPEILGYQYIGNLSDYQNKNIKEDRLRQYLRLKGYADKLIDAAVMQLQQEAGNLSRGVYDANKTVYSRLKYGIPVSESPEKPPVTVELIDEANPLNNDFLVETEAESVISDDVNDADDTEVPETEEQEIIEVSKLQPKEIEDYVNSLKDKQRSWKKSSLLRLSAI